MRKYHLHGPEFTRLFPLGLSVRFDTTVFTRNEYVGKSEVDRSFHHAIKSGHDFGYLLFLSSFIRIK